MLISTIRAFISYCSVVVRKCLTKKFTEGMGFAHGLRVQSILIGKSWRQEPETAAHTMSTVKKQAVVPAGTQLAGFFLFSRGPQASAGATHI